MLQSVQLLNFKTHRDTEIHLERLTVLVGPNGAGKSSVLQATALAGRAVMKRGQRQRASEIQSMKRTGAPGERVGPCSIVLKGRSDHHSWRCSLTEGGLDESGPGCVELTRSAFLALSPARLAEPVPMSELDPRLAPDGYGLADLVATMRLADEDAFQGLQAALREVVPQVERIKVKRTKIPFWKAVALQGQDGPEVAQESDPRLGHELAFDVSGNRDIPAGMMSGGTLATVGILALLYSRARPHILLLDDLDHALHPKAQWDLLKQLRRLLDRFQELQIVATSHSPDLVDELAPEEVVVMTLREDGTSAAKPLSECPRSDMLEVLKSGQLWSAVGEDWVKESKQPTGSAA